MAYKYINESFKLNRVKMIFPALYKPATHKNNDFYGANFIIKADDEVNLSLIKGVINNFVKRNGLEVGKHLKEDGFLLKQIPKDSEYDAGAYSISCKNYVNPKYTQIPEVFDHMKRPVSEDQAGDLKGSIVNAIIDLYYGETAKVVSARIAVVQILGTTKETRINELSVEDPIIEDITVNEIDNGVTKIDDPFK